MPCYTHTFHDDKDLGNIELGKFDSCHGIILCCLHKPIVFLGHKRERESIRSSWLRNISVSELLYRDL